MSMDYENSQNLIQKGKKCIKQVIIGYFNTLLYTRLGLKDAQPAGVRSRNAKNVLGSYRLGVLAWPFTQRKFGLTYGRRKRSMGYPTRLVNMGNILSFPDTG